MNGMLFVFLGCGISIWFLWLGESKKLIKELEGNLTFLMEKDYVFLCSKNSIDNPLKQIGLRVIYSILAFLFWFALRKAEMDIFNLVLAIGIFLSVYYGQYAILKMKYVRLLALAKKEFPYYLNHLAILVQSNPVVNALEKSIEEAPAVFHQELRELVINIHHNGSSIQPYLQFAQQFAQVDQISRIMRTLYNLSITSENREAILTVFSRMTNEKIQGARKIELQRRLERQNMIPYSLFLWLGFIILSMIASIQLG